MSILNVDVFLKEGGIFRCTIEALFGCDEFFLQRQEVFSNFFHKCMTNPSSSQEIITLLFGLTTGYHNLYSTMVTKSCGSLEKRHRAGKLLIQKFESCRISLAEEYLTKFSNLICTSEYLLLMEDGTFEINRFEDSNLLFGFIEQYLYDNYWKWLHIEKGIDVSNFIKERTDDASYEFSPTMLDKIYDITGYLCGARLSNVLKYNRLKSEYRFVFTEYFTHSRHSTGAMALEAGLPANYLLFRQHSEGLYFARGDNFQFIKIMQAIYMQSLSTDVLILFNSSEPVKLVHEVILNSELVQKAFKKSCYMLNDYFDSTIDIAKDKSAICYLFQFLVQGFIRVYSKDIYQLRLSNVLLSKTGASGVRTALLTLSAESEKKKSKATSSAVSEKHSMPNNSCPCGKKFTGNGWYCRHILSCNKYITQHTSNIDIVVADNESVLLDNLIELECLQEFGDYDYDADMEGLLAIESNSEKEENSFDSNFVSNIVIDEAE